MKLYLTQHGEALSKELDAQRPLSKKGVADVEKLAKFLKQANVKFDRIIHSGKLRAEQTAIHLANHINNDIELETTGIINPNDSPEAFAMQSDSWEGDTLIVGHLPFMARLVSHLLNNEDEPLIVAYQPGSVVCLECNADKKWLINWMIRPELLSS